MHAVTPTSTQCVHDACRIKNLIVAFLWGPDPWVSPLHVACRLGLTDITVLLLDRCALVNGGNSCIFCRQSPLEEALQYARSNFTWDNTMAGKWTGTKHANDHLPILTQYT